MRPAFSNALYYPTIDIKDTNWLKTAALFWDSIATIVPESLAHPYTQPDTQYLADIGFLRPLYVNPTDKSVVGIEDDILNLLSSPELREAIASPHIDMNGGIWNEKMSYRLRKELDNFSKDSIYREKMSVRVQEEAKYISRHLDDQEVFYFDREFAYVYMIALANRLCEDHSLGMVTNDSSSFKMGNAAKWGSQSIQRPRDHQLEQGLLLNFIIKDGLSVSPDTPFSDIVSFRTRHRDELGKFKTKLTELTQNLDGDRPIEVMQQEISDLYFNEVEPAFHDLKASLKSSKIKCFAKTLFNISTLSVSDTVATALLGMSAGQALLAGAGISVVASVIPYNEDKKAILRNNPYSYLLSINREWPRNS